MRPLNHRSKWGFKDFGDGFAEVGLYDNDVASLPAQWVLPYQQFSLHGAIMPWVWDLEYLTSYPLLFSGSPWILMTIFHLTCVSHLMYLLCMSLLIMHWTLLCGASHLETTNARHIFKIQENQNSNFSFFELHGGRSFVMPQTTQKCTKQNMVCQKTHIRLSGYQGAAVAQLTCSQCK